MAIAQELAKIHPIKREPSLTPPKVHHHIYFRSARRGIGGEGQCRAGGGGNRSSAWTYNCPFGYNE